MDENLAIDSNNAREKLLLRFSTFRFSCDRKTTDYWSVYGICFAGEYRSLLSTLTESDGVIDAGANIGVFSVLASKKVKKVIAIEPSPKAYAYLLENLQLNSITNVQPIQAALSRSEGTVHLLGSGLGAHLGDRGFQVRSMTLGTLMAERPTVIKMAIEGAEVDALGTAGELEGVRELAIEADGTLETLLDRIQRLGFRTHVHSPERALFMRGFSADFLANGITTRFAATRMIVWKLTQGQRPIHSLYEGPVKLLYGTRLHPEGAFSNVSIPNRR